VKWSMTCMIAVGLSIGAVGAATAQSHDHGYAGHAAHSRGDVDTPAVRVFKVAHARMVRNMDKPFTGDPDVDFRTHMIPHHQGAIDMARIVLRYAKDVWTKQNAEAIILAQQQEIAQFQDWLARHGKKVPAGGQPLYIPKSATAYPDLDQPERTGGGNDDRGSQNELVGRTWAPGSGVPLQAAQSAASATREFEAAHALMMRNMDKPFTGDPDVDFRTHMIPHHQGAIDMARVALRHARDAQTRQAAQAIITAQQREIATFEAWLKRHAALIP
jgi:uncharacterized protein (DUF305 family)